MLEVRNLSKRYGAFSAVDGINFSIEKGEIVGFLGPNGAGKTTTFRMLAQYFPPDSGSIRMLDLDPSKESLSIRGRIGYLAENNPLWHGMEITEYLSMLWEIRELGGTEAKKRRIGEVLKDCGLIDVLGKEIGDLSKGYRQRVGLAAAILHNPDILLLDEPTSGLDPIQAREVRGLIQGFKGKKTILLSTHILSEVQAVCDRVLIIHKGRLAADRKTADLSAHEQEYTILLHTARVLIDGVEDLGGLKNVLGVEGPLPVRHGEVAYRIRASSDVRGEVFKYASRRLLPVLEIKMEQRSLEDVFHELTRESEPEQKPEAVEAGE